MLNLAKPLRNRGKLLAESHLLLGRILGNYFGNWVFEQLLII